jgi:hypothetical protein
MKCSLNLRGKPLASTMLAVMEFERQLQTYSSDTLLINHIFFGF